MSYFNHAYKKTMLLSTYGVNVTTSLASHELRAGEIAMCAADTYAVLSSASAVPSEFVLVQGNYNNTQTTNIAVTSAMDTIGGNKLHGGYAESVKSKNIKANYITKVWKESCLDQDGAECFTIRVTDNCYTCTRHAQMRIDIKGEAVLRTLNHNVSEIVDSKGCCTDTDGTMSFTSLDVVTGWVNAINDDPLMSPWITASAPTQASGYSTMVLCLNEVDEENFGDCSFDSRDWYNTEPLQLTVTEIDDEGDACATGCILDNSGTALPVEGLTVVTPADSVSGETVLRDLIQDSRYRQDGGWNQGNRDSARFREIQKSDNLLAAVDRAAKYTIYYLQHSVPRYNNPTGVFDNDQYVVAIAVACSQTAEITAMDILWDDIAGKASLPVPVTTDGLVV